jgi:hypothetical protein
MMVFGVGALAGLASIFFAYLRRLFRLERPLLFASHKNQPRPPMLKCKPVSAFLAC